LFKSEIKLKVIEFLLKHEASMSEREIASVLKISHMSVNRTMPELSAMNLVHYIAVGKAHLWKVNRQSFASIPPWGVRQEKLIDENQLEPLAAMDAGVLKF